MSSIEACFSVPVLTFCGICRFPPCYQREHPSYQTILQAQGAAWHGDPSHTCNPAINKAQVSLQYCYTDHVRLNC